MIRLVVGLGNPGKEYEKTRHNIGWMILDRLSQILGCPFSKEKFKGLLAECNVEGRKVFLLKPTTYMNRSGESVGEFVRFYKLRPEEVLAIYDDLDLPLGKVRIRPKGSSGGHRGVLSLEQHLETNEFPRIRVGIGRPERKEDVVEYVLSPFADRELETVIDVIDRAARCTVEIIKQGSVDNKIMSKCNN